MSSEIDPVEFGKLVHAVETLTEATKEIKADLDSLKATFKGGKGLLAGLMIAAGGIGAGAKHVLESLLK